VVEIGIKTTEIFIAIQVVGEKQTVMPNLNTTVIETYHREILQVSPLQLLLEKVHCKALLMWQVGWRAAAK